MEFYRPKKLAWPHKIRMAKSTIQYESSHKTKEKSEMLAANNNINESNKNQQISMSAQLATSLVQEVSANDNIDTLVDQSYSDKKEDECKSIQTSESILDQLLDRHGVELSKNRVVDLGSTDGHSVAYGASQILSGNAYIVVVLTNLIQQKLRMQTTLTSGSKETSPRDVLILPGSFNPPHQGHVGLANAAISALRRLRQRDEHDGNYIISTSTSNSRYSSMSSTSSSSSRIRYDSIVFFDLPLRNIDKPPLEPREAERRVNFFKALPLSDMPKYWAVILTHVPLFLQDTTVLNELIPCTQSDFGAQCKIHFVVGTDTMVRITKPKYYGSHENMIASLLEMKDRGVHFIVGGRLEQGTETK